MNTATKFVSRSEPKPEGIEPAEWIEAGAIMSMLVTVARSRLLREDRGPVLRLVAKHDAREVVRARARARLRVRAPAEEDIQWTCPKCEHVGPPDDFGMRRMGNGKIRRQSQCRKCRLLAAKASRAKKREPAPPPEVVEWLEAVSQPTVIKLAPRE